MKSLPLILSLIAASSYTSLYAQKEAAPRPPQPPPPPAPSAQYPGPREPRASEKVSFLGIMTSPVSPTLTEQLGLPRDMGLVVTGVVPDSPAAGILKSHDILTKLNDQLLIETRQLAVLVRSFKENEEVTLTFIRAGKEMTAKVKLSQREVPKDARLKGRNSDHALSMDLMSPESDDRAPRDLDMIRERALGERADRLNEAHASASRAREDAMAARDAARLQHEAAKAEADRILSLIGTDVAAGPRTIRSSGEGNGKVTIINTRDGNVVFNDKDGMMKLTSENGQRMLLAKGVTGATLFSGPVSTPEERKALSPELRDRLEKLENMKGLSFKTDSDFEPGDIRVAPPNPHSISLTHAARPNGWSGDDSL